MTDKAMHKSCKTHPELLAKLEAVREYKMNRAERNDQRKSWVRGEIMLANPDMTKEDFENIWRQNHD